MAGLYQLKYLMPSDPLADFDAEIYDFLRAANIQPEQVIMNVPPQREFGERAINVFRLAKERRQAPAAIASELIQSFDPARYRFIDRVEQAGQGFVNFFVRYETFGPRVVQAISESGAGYGRRDSVRPQHVVVEHTSVNPNKEWHIGHVRNAVLGDVIGRLLTHLGHEVEIQNYIDDTGLQAAQAVFAVERFSDEAREGEKHDHYVGRQYVKVAAELGAERDLKELLQRLPDDDEGVMEQDAVGFGERETIEARLENIQRLQTNVVATMHALEHGEHHDEVASVLQAQLQTAYRLGIFYNLLNWESHLVQSHCFDQAMQRLQTSPRVFRPPQGRYAGALVIQMGDSPTEGEEARAEVLIRSNGIPTYVGKDIAYSMWKFRLLPDPIRYVEFSLQPNGVCLYSTALSGETRDGAVPERVINVIGVHQSQAQEAVQEGLRAAGFDDAAARLFHLAYGMVSTREGKISGRKGTAVSADSVIEQAVAVAYDKVAERRSDDLDEAEMRSIAEAVGVGAVRYFMAQYNPARDIVFDVNDVVSYDGNTGLYVQYALVRMFAILRRAGEDRSSQPVMGSADLSLLQHEQEKRLVFQLAQYPETAATAGKTLAINLIAEYAFELATIFNQFYRDCGVLNAEPATRAARLELVTAVRDVLSHACGLLGVPVIERL